MALWGYNKKTYDKNTETFRARLQNVRDNLPGSENNKTTIAQALDLVIKHFDRFEYSVIKNRKAQEAADKHIEELIYGIEAFANNNTDIFMMLYLKLLNDVLLSDVRINGTFANYEKAFSSNIKFVEVLFELSCAMAEEECLKNEMDKTMFTSRSFRDNPYSPETFNSQHDILSASKSSVSERIDNYFNSLRVYRETYKESISSVEYQFYDELIGNRFMYEDRFVKRVYDSIYNKILDR